MRANSLKLFLLNALSSVFECSVHIVGNSLIDPTVIDPTVIDPL